MLTDHDRESIARIVDNNLRHWLGITTFLILAQGEQIMAAIDDLNGAVANLGTAVTDLDARIGTLGSVNDPAIEAATAAVQGAADHLNTLAT